MTAFGRPLRRRFLLERGTAFLNHGSFGTTPRVVHAAADRWRRRMEANPDRFLREVLPAALRGAASRIARFVRANPEDVVFVENATTGVNAVLRSLKFAPGDEILSTTHTYNAVRQAIRHVCERSGAKPVEATIDLPVSREIDLIDAIEEKFSRATRLLVLDHISSPTGLVFPVARIARAARRRGIQVLVDGAHAPGQIPLDIPALGVDWYSANCHKWLYAPKGSAFLWARRTAQKGLHPTVISHGYGKGFAAEFDWTGTRDFSAWLSIPDALDFFENLGAQRLRTYCHRLVVQKAKEISAAWKTGCDGPPELHGSMMAIRMPAALQGREPRGLMAEMMEQHRVVVAPMQVGSVLWARISGQVYNVPSDYDRLLKTIGRC